MIVSRRRGCRHLRLPFEVVSLYVYTYICPAYEHRASISFHFISILIFARSLRRVFSIFFISFCTCTLYVYNILHIAEAFHMNLSFIVLSKLVLTKWKKWEMHQKYVINFCHKSVFEASENWAILSDIHTKLPQNNTQILTNVVRMINRERDNSIKYIVISSRWKSDRRLNKHITN